MVEFQVKKRYNINDLIDIVNILRSDHGCPWDKEQTHETLKSNLLEESYEVFEAIDNNDPSSMKEELGDVLLQVVFHSAIEQENDTFNFDDVADDICKKLILRHPHVFGNVKVDNTDDVLKNWEKIKIDSKQQTPKQAMENITKTLPALLRATKLHSKAKKFNISDIDTNNIFNVMVDTVQSMGNMLQYDNKNNCIPQLQDYIGKILFLCTGIASAYNIDPELALNDECNHFLMNLKYK